MPSRYLAAPSHVCPVTLWRFAVPVAIGTFAGGAAAWAARRMMHRDPNLTRDAVAAIAHTAAFWLVGGAVWVFLARRPDGPAA